MMTSSIQKIYRLLFVFVVLMSMTVSAMAQDRVTSTFEIKVGYKSDGSDGNIPYSLKYTAVKTVAKAEAIKKILEEAIQKDGYAGGEQFENACDANNINLKNGKSNGTFDVRTFPGQAVLVYANEQIFAVYQIKEGVTNYKQFIKLSMDNTSLQQVNVTDNRKRSDLDLKALPPIDDGKTMYVPIVVNLPKGIVDEKSRILIQPYAVECETEDTAAYVTPLVYEGSRYHLLQDRRMDYDFHKNDDVAAGYVNDKLSKDLAFHADTTVEWTKTDPARDYKFTYFVVAEDYNHEIIRLSKSAGSCNKFKYFKFLDLGNIAVDMDIHEFKVQAEDNYVKMDRDFNLKFEVGKWELLPDSANIAEQEALIKELRSYGELLMNYTIEASASPDGGYEKNKQLAKQRRDVALNIVRRGLGRNDATAFISEPKVYTWDEVAQRVDSLYSKEKGDSLRTAITAGGAYPDRTIRQLPFYEPVIVPILEKMRSMRCTYNYERAHVMDEDEVLDYYYKNKKKLLDASDPKIKLSEGDYYNLFIAIKDSLEQDTLTIMAYNHMRRQPAWEKIKFSQYVNNRKAVLDLRLGVPNLETLKPYIDLTGSYVTYANLNARGEAAASIAMNREEILLNQIVAYYQEEKRDSALAMLNHWFADRNSPKVALIRNYIEFKENFMKYYLGKLSDVQMQEFEKTMNMVFEQSPANKAVLYTEARQLMHKTNGECLELINKLEDDDPKKWYLLGIIEADEELSRDVKKQKNYIPTYLALFYKAIQLEPSYRLLYFKEAHVSDELREKYKYRKRDFPRYEQLLKEYLENKGQATDDDDLSGEGVDIDMTTEAVPTETPQPDNTQAVDSEK